MEPIKSLKEYLEAEPGLRESHDRLCSNFIRGHVYFYDEAGALLEDRITTSYNEHCLVRQKERNTVGRESDRLEFKDSPREVFPESVPQVSDGDSLAEVANKEFTDKEGNKYKFYDIEKFDESWNALPSDLRYFAIETMMGKLGWQVQNTLIPREYLMVCQPNGLATSGEIGRLINSGELVEVSA